MKLSDIMVKDVITVSPDELVVDVLKRLCDRRISGLPVVNSNNEVIGMITEKDVLQYILPDYIKNLETVSYLPADDPFHGKMEIPKSLKVKEIMRKEHVVCLDENTNVMEAILVMLKQKVRRIPILSKGKLVGLVARFDIVKEILKLSGIVKG